MQTAAFDAHFEKFYLAHLLQDAAFLQRVRADIAPEMFASTLAQRVVRLVLNFVDEHEAPPDKLIYTELEFLAQKAGLKQTDFNALHTYLEQVFELPLQNRSFLLREHDRFVRHQELQQSFPQFANLVQTARFDEAEELLKRIVTKRPGRDLTPGSRMDIDPSARIERRRQSEGERFWLLIPEIDRIVDGLKAGELGIVQSQRSSIGKTAFLVHIARSWVFQGKKVLVYTLEDSEHDWQDRLDQCVAGITQDHLFDYETIRTEMARWFGHRGDILIKQFPAQMTSVSDLQRHKTMVANTIGFHADGILVDAGDELVPEGGPVIDLFSAGKRVYGGLKGWAEHDEVPLWTTMQSGRGAAEKSYADQEDASESIARVWVADVILSINRTPKETEEGLTRIHVVKNRRGLARVTRTIRTKLSSQEFYKISS